MIFEVEACVLKLNEDPFPSFAGKAPSHAVGESWLDLFYHIEVFYDLAKQEDGRFHWWDYIQSTKIYQISNNTLFFHFHPPCGQLNSSRNLMLHIFLIWNNAAIMFVLRQLAGATFKM